MYYVPPRNRAHSLSSFHFRSLEENHRCDPSVLAYGVLLPTRRFYFFTNGFLACSASAISPLILQPSGARKRPLMLGK